MIRAALLCLALVLSSFPALASSGKIISVQEGDRLTLLQNGKKVRLFLYGIDAPELKQSHGTEAREFLASFVNGETVEVTPVGVEKKNTVTGVVLLGGDNINELLLLNGHAWVDRNQCTEDFCTKWIKMEEAAKATLKGLWINSEALPPWVFRQLGKKKTSIKKKAPEKEQ